MSKCAEFDGFLASAPSIDIHEYLFKIVGYESFFLGGNSKSSEYVWEDGTPWNWTNWDSGAADENMGKFINHRLPILISRLFFLETKKLLVWLSQPVIN